MMLFPAIVPAQDYGFEQLYEAILKDNRQSAALKIKTELVYLHKNENDKGEFLYKKQFDTNGRLLKSRWLDESVNKFVDSEFSYDAEGRLIKITNTINSLVYNLDQTEIEYAVNNKPSQILHYYGPKDAIKMDTLHFIYDQRGSLIHKIFKHRIDKQWITDTINYVYSDEVLWYTQCIKKMEPKTNYMAAVSFGIAGAMVGVMLWVNLDNHIGKYESNFVVNTDNCDTIVHYPNKKDYISLTRDSLCNILHWENTTDVKGKWVITEEGDQKFKGELKTEEKIYSGKVSFDATRNGMKSFEQHILYDYSPQSLLLKKCWLKENGKVKRIEKYSYEFYN